MSSSSSLQGPKLSSKMTPGFIVGFCEEQHVEDTIGGEASIYGLGRGIGKNPIQQDLVMTVMAGYHFSPV